MSARRNFAANLRRLCLTRGSISAASRQLGIHRAQMEKYLTGKSEPNAETRRTICLFFGVDEAQIYQTPDDAGFGERVDLGHFNVLDEGRKLVQPLLREPAASIATGLYYLYFTMPGHPGKLVCALMAIGRRGAATLFRRLTHRSDGYAGQRSQAFGDHRGLVVERWGAFLFMGINACGVHEPSLLRLHWLNTTDAMLGGYAMVHTPNGWSFASIIMQPVNSRATLMETVRASRSRSADNALIPPLIHELIARQGANLIDTLRRELGR